MTNIEMKQKTNKENLSNELSFISTEERNKNNHHKGGIIWLTGLSGSGKSTIAKHVEKTLFDQGKQVYILDGDNIRQGLSKDLKFSPEDRSENIRRIAEVSLLFAKAGIIVIAAFISPIYKDRKYAKEIAKDLFHCIYISASIDTCKKRDPKGLYEKAINGEIKDFTGISAPYETPEHPNLIIDTNNSSIEHSSNQLINYINSNLSI